MNRDHVNVLFFSSMAVSPFSGGGNTIYNLLEPPMGQCQVYYVTDKESNKSKPVFDSIMDRAYFINFPIPKKMVVSPSVPLFPLFNRVVKKRYKWEVAQLRKRIVKFTTKIIASKRINLLFLCPQGGLIHESVALIKATNLPVISWFMDDYYTSGIHRRLAEEIWNLSQIRFVISEYMKERFIDRFGLDAEVLNNSVEFSSSPPPPPKKRDSCLNVAYSGRLHSYYADTMRYVISEVEKLNGAVRLFIYSQDKLPIGENSSGFIKFFPPVKPEALSSRLQECDVVLVLSSFAPEYKEICETSLASKLANYMSSARTLIAVGPEYSANIRFIQDKNIGLVITSNSPGELSKLFENLITNRDQLNDLAYRAYRFGFVHHNKTHNHQRLWDMIIRLSHEYYV